jgi:hypothetical protein
MTSFSTYFLIAMTISMQTILNQGRNLSGKLRAAIPCPIASSIEPIGCLGCALANRLATVF